MQNYNVPEAILKMLRYNLEVFVYVYVYEFLADALIQSNMQ